MEGVNLVLLAVVLAGVFTEFTQAETLDNEEETQKFIGNRYEPCNSLHNTTLQVLSTLESSVKSELEKQGQNVQLFTERIEESLKQINAKCPPLTDATSSTPSRCKDSIASEHGFSMSDSTVVKKEDDQAILANKLWKRQDQKFEDIGNAIVNLRNEFTIKSNDLMNRFASLEDTMSTSLQQITDSEELKKEFQKNLTQQETKQQERFEALTRKYETLENSVTEMRSALEAKLTSSVVQMVSEMSKAVKTMLASITAQSDGISSVVQTQTQKIEQLESSIGERFEKQERKIQETIQAVSDVKSDFFQANHDFSKNYEHLENSTLQIINKLDLNLQNVTQQSEIASIDFRNMYYDQLEVKSAVSKIQDTVSTNNEIITQKCESLENSILKGFSSMETITKEEMRLRMLHLAAEEERVNMLSQKFNETTYYTLKPSLENITTNVQRIWNVVQSQTQLVEQHHISTLNEFKKQEKIFNATSNRIPPNTPEILETVSNGIQTMREITLGERKGFLTTPRYSNVRMVTDLTDQFPQITFPKAVGMNGASYKCQLQCEERSSCKALNVIEKEDSFVCELLPDNLCLNQTRNALLNWPGSILWEKVSTSTGRSCLEQKFPSGKQISCETVRPGCFGNWPDCSSCFKTCIDSKKVYKFDHGYYYATLWPEGDGPYTTPIFGRCFNSFTVLVSRRVNVDPAKVNWNYVMPFPDINRINRLQVYPYIHFAFFNTSGVVHRVEYDYPVIETDGTLSNITLRSQVNMKDIFNLDGYRLRKPIPFVTVTDDRHGCGSFWLIDPNNSTYCPGGQVKALGELRTKNGKAISTGMSIPESIKGSPYLLDLVVITLEDS